MRFTQQQRRYFPLRVLGRSNHAWKLGSKLYKEEGICGKCGYDSFENVHREIIKEVREDGRL